DVHRDLHSFPTRRSSDLFTSKTVPTLDNYGPRKIFQCPWTNTQCLIRADEESVLRDMRKGDIIADGPFHSLFGGPVARVLDEARSEEHTSELQSRGHLVC